MRESREYRTARQTAPWRIRVATIMVILMTVSTALPQPSMRMEAQTPERTQWVHLSTAKGDLQVPANSRSQTSTLILDIDKDGINDFVIAVRRSEDHSVVWYRRHADGWTRHIIEPEALSIEASGAFFDITGNGALDIVFGADGGSNEIWWWENPYPNYDPNVPWTRRVIKNTGARKHHDMIFGDLTGDGKAEFVFWNQGGRQLMIAPIPADPRNTQPWPHQAIYTYTGEIDYEGLYAADIDLDGKLDIVGAGLWFKHEGGLTFTPHVIDAAMPFTRTAVGQLIAGGRPEVVISSGDAIGPLMMYQWDGSTWVGRDLLGYDLYNAHSLQIGDIDGDGHLDIFVAEMNLRAENPDAKMLVLFGDGQGGFEVQTVATGIANHESRIGDLDGDGDLDILGKPYEWGTPRLDIWLNGGTRPPLDDWQRHIIGTSDYRLLSVHTGDINGDGLPDVIAGAWWFENPGHPAGAWTRHSLPEIGQVAAVHDFTGDGRPDLFGTRGVGSETNSELLWLENLGGGNWTEHPNVASAGGTFLQGVVVADLVPGGTTEIALSWHDERVGVHMLRVPDNPRDPWPIEVISAFSLGEDLSAGDINGNGRLDLLLGTSWLENPGATGTPWTAHTIHGSADLEPDRNALADINGNGRLDAVVGYEKSTDLVWFEAPTDPRQPWTRHVIASDIGFGFSLDVADFTRDGRPDVVLGEHKGATRVMLYQNLDGGADWRAHIVDDGSLRHDHHVGTQARDVTGNGFLDIVSIGWNHNNILLYTQPDPSLSPGPVIDVWYGARQRFGQLGNPQRWVNILGQISSPAGIASASFRLGGVTENLPLGRDSLRLANPGDFNIEIDRARLNAGDNLVTITATDTEGRQSERPVTIAYTPNRVWPHRYTIDWGTVSDLQDVVQVVDGLWHVEGDTVRTVGADAYAYDRLLALGDVAWTDYEVTVPITIHAMYGNDPGVGLLFRWQGHADDASRPRYGHPLGALGWYRVPPGAPPARLSILGNAKDDIAYDEARRALPLGVPHVFKMRAETQPTGTTIYSLKVWEQGTPEPAGWDLSGAGHHVNPAEVQGSVLLVAHRADVSFGPVTVMPVGETYSLTLNAHQGGRIDASPAYDTYYRGEQVTLQAVSEPGWTFTGWSGAATDTANPIALTIAGDTVVAAHFARELYTFEVGTRGRGAVVRNPNQSHFMYGDTVELRASPDTGWRFARWEGDHNTTENPTVLTVTGPTTVMAVFVEPYALTVYHAGGGSGEVLREPDKEGYALGEQVRLTAAPDDGSRFLSWEGAATGSDPSVTVVMTEDTAVTVRFGLIGATGEHRTILPLVLSTWAAP